LQTAARWGIFSGDVFLGSRFPTGRSPVFERVLVLNASFEPLNVINWRRAVKLVVLRKVEVLQESERVVCSARTAVRVPAVVRLVRFVHFHRWDVKLSRENIYARDKYRCQYCGEELRSKELTCDHVIPRSRGGATEWINVVTCCADCNRKKGGKTPEEAGLSLLKNPARPSWLVGFQTRFTSTDPPPAWRDYLYGLQGS
jgi:5-methylcytosine-specific restriction endonuclease McrA